VALIFFMEMIAMAQIASIQLDGRTFRVLGWNAPATAPRSGWPSVFAIYAGTGDVPPLEGSYTVRNRTLEFVPRFPFAPGVRYRAVFRAPGGPAVEKVFDGPARPTAATARVAAVYPSGEVLPSNQLRLYIVFSAPMSRGEAGSRIRLLDQNGNVLPDVFLPGQELWDPAFQRLTMTFDPGRIKRGLVSNETMGQPITEGKRYTLVIDREWKDARGVPLIEGFKKSFRAGPPDRTPPDPGQWRVTPPRAGSTDALVVNFPQPMNYPLLQRMLRVATTRGAVAGSASVALQETQWRFTPSEPWARGAYKLIVDNALEDLAGNHIGQPFDIDVFERVTEHITSQATSLPFVIR
jgi:hypothetical protein